VLCTLAVLGDTTATWAETAPDDDATRAMQSTPSHVAGDLAAHMSETASAMEYWDVAAWLESGERLFARFLVTNEGPGVRTAAAVGHVVLPDATMVPFKWGRRSDAWTLGGGGGKLTIAKAVLDVDGPMVVVAVDSNKQGVKLRLEIERAGELVAMRPVPGEYGVDVAMPAPAHGRLWARGMSSPREVSGTGVVTHAWMERPEADLIRQRIETFARNDDIALYLSALTLADGRPRTTAVAKGSGILVRTDDAAVDFARATPGGDPRYPVPARLNLRNGTLALSVDVRRELLRWDPLEIVPQPFRMLLALGGPPQRVWCDATVDVAVTAGGPAPFRARTGGIVAATFAGAVPLPD
jgi:hypothetical protein